MMRKRIQLLGVSMLSLSFSLMAAADDAPEQLTQDTVRVVGTYLYTDQVNALKTPTPIIDVPQSLSIITADQIAEQGFDSIGDLIAYTPGVTTSQGEGHRDSVVFRGVRSTADFFLDGVRDDVQYYRPLYNLEQVEVLRGPNALLFGRGGTGGILNRVTKKGVLGEDFTGYRAGIDSFGGWSAQIDHNVSVTETSAFRLNAMYESLDGHRDFYDGERWGINPTARFQLTPDTLIDLSYEYVDHQRFIDRGIPTGADGRPVEAFADIVFGDRDVNSGELQAHLFRASLQHAFSESLKGNLSAFYGDYDKSYTNFYAAAYNPVTNIVTLDGYVDTNQRQNFILSGNLIGEFELGGLGHTLIGGAEYIDTTNNNDRWNSFFDQSADDQERFFVQRPIALINGVGTNANGLTTTNDFSVDLNDDTHASVDVFSAYVQDEIEVTDWLDVIIGARFDRFEIEVFNVVANETRNRTDEEISPRFGVVLKPQENVSFYGSYSETFLPRSGEQFTDINGANNALDPDTYTNREVGAKWDLDMGLSLTAAIFEIEQSSPQVADNDPSTLEVIESEITGFELQAQGYLTHDWFISAGYSNLDGEVVNRSGPTGLRPRELPEHMFSVWSTYQVTDAFGFGLGATYQDETFIDNGNNAVLPGYTRIDAAAFYDVSDQVRVQLNIENVTDELYFPNAHSTHQVSVGAPLNARLSVSGRF